MGLWSGHVRKEYVWFLDVLLKFGITKGSRFYGNSPKACLVYSRSVITEIATSYLMEIPTAPDQNGHMDWPQCMRN